MKLNKKYDMADMVVFIVFTIFFGTLFLTGEPLYLGDTFQHENQFVTREPVYALLIQLMKTVSEKYAFKLVILIQNLLAIVSNTIFVCFIRRYFQLNKFLIFIVCLVTLSPHIITPLASATNMVLTNSLLSEGISFSLYLYFVIYLLKAIESREILGKYTFCTLGWAVFLSLVRGQLMTLIIVWLCTISIIAIREHKGKKILILLIAFVISFAGRTLAVKTYNYLEQGLFVSTASGQAMSIANVIYVADREDGQAIQNDDIREMFYEIYDSAYKDEMTYQFSSKGIIERAKHHEKCHDALNFDYFAEAAKAYIGETKGIYVTDYQLLMVEVDKIASVMMKDLLPQVLGKYIVNYVSVVTMGFIRSVSYVHPILNWYALVIYLAAIILMLLLWRVKKDSKAAPFMAVVLLMIIGNVTATALMLQCISRYMIYNLPLFYIAGLVMMIEYAQIIKNKKS